MCGEDALMISKYALTKREQWSARSSAYDSWIVYKQLWEMDHHIVSTHLQPTGNCLQSVNCTPDSAEDAEYF